MATPGKSDVDVTVGGDNRNLKSSLDESRRLIGQFSRLGQSALGPFGRQLTGIVSNILSARGAIATLAGTGGLGLLINRSIEAADRIGKTASRIGLSVEGYQELKFAAGEAGVAVELFDTAMTALVRRQGEAIAGNKGFAEAFQRIGISVEELRELRPEDLLGRVADGVNDLGSQSAKLAALDRVMSEAGRRLVNFTDLGSEGLAKLRQEARDMGVVLDSVMVREAERAGDQLARLANIIRTNLTRAFLTLTPQIIATAEALVERLGPFVEWFTRQLPDTAVAADALRERMAAVRGEIEALAGMPLPQVLQLVKDGMRLDIEGDELGRKLHELILRYAELNTLLTERVRKEAMIATALQGTGTATAAATDKIGDLVSALQFEIEQLPRSAAEQRLYNEAKKAGIEDVDALRQAIGPLIEEHERLKAAQAASDAAAQNATKAWQDNMAAGKAVFDATRTPLEQYQAKIAELNELLDYGAIGQDTYNRAVIQAQDAFDKAAEKTDGLARAQDTLARSVTDGASAALRGNMRDWNDWGSFAINTITRVWEAWVESQIAMSKGGGSGGGIGGIFGSIFSGIVGIAGLFGGGSPVSIVGGGMRPTPHTPPYIPSSGPVLPPLYGDGGMHPGGWRVVGDRGPELEATGPARIYSAEQTARILAGRDGGRGMGTVINQTFVNPTRDSIPEIVAAVRALGVTVRQIDSTLEPRAVRAVSNARGRDPELFVGVS
ncbi:MAG: hypothetical protein Kow00114_32920 [Kiloniellaceae bacterium]